MKIRESGRSVGICESPVGILTVICTDKGVKAIEFPKEEAEQPVRGESLQADAMLDWTIRELQEYFAGKREDFTVPCDMKGTEFQKRVWNALKEIPYGKTCSYKEIAEKAGSPRAYRAVGMANHCNPIPIIVPCHRVVGADGKLTGYAGGLERKKTLLGLERRQEAAQDK